MIDIVYTCRVDNKHVAWFQQQVIAELARTRLKRTVLHKYHTLCIYTLSGKIMQIMKAQARNSKKRVQC